MKGIVNICIVIAAICLVIALISRMTLTPVGPMNIQAHALLQAANTSLLVAVLALLLKAKT